MEHPALSADGHDMTPPPALLPGDRSDWPEPARAAFHDVLRQLDRWCRQHDWPTAGNAWVAEEAVRRSW